MKWHGKVSGCACSSSQGKQQNHNLPCWALFIPNPMPWATILQHKCVRGMRKDREARLTPQLLTQKLTRSWWWPCCNPRRLCVCAGRGAGGSHASHSKSSTGRTPFKLSEATRETSTSSVRSTPAWQIQKMCRICTTAWRSALAYQHHFLERNKYSIHMPCLLYKNVQFQSRL